MDADNVTSELFKPLKSFGLGSNSGLKPLKKETPQILIAERLAFE
jgi:hypothetical protein